MFSFDIVYEENLSYLLLFHWSTMSPNLSSQLLWKKLGFICLIDLIWYWHCLGFIMFLESVLCLFLSPKTKTEQFKKRKEKKNLGLYLSKHWSSELSPSLLLFKSPLTNICNFIIYLFICHSPLFYLLFSILSAIFDLCASVRISLLNSLLYNLILLSTLSIVLLNPSIKMCCIFCSRFFSLYT